MRSRARPDLWGPWAGDGPGPPDRTQVPAALEPVRPAWASSYESPCRITSAPRVRTASTLMRGVVTGMTITARQPSFCAASATPWAWCRPTTR